MKNSYDTADVSCLMDTRLSWKATGLLAYLLARRGQDIRISDLVQVKKDGRASVCSALKELEEAGCIIRRQVIDKKGRFDGIEYNFVTRTE